MAVGSSLCMLADGSRNAFTTEDAEDTEEKRDEMFEKIEPARDSSGFEYAEGTEEAFSLESSSWFSSVSSASSVVN
jgi:hypothetical protein